MVKRWWLFAILWAVYGCLTSPVWERAGIAFGIDPMQYAPGAWLHRAPSSNDAANFATIQALVERQTWAIDESMFDTADKARIGNKTYSVRPPMLAAIGSAIYGVLFTTGHRFVDSPGVCHWWLVWLTSGLATAAGAWAVASTVDSLALVGEPPGGLSGSKTSRAGTAAGLTYGLASLALPYALAFNHHAPAAGCVALGIYLLIRSDLNPGRSLTAGRSVALSGALFGLATTFDLAGGGLSTFAVGVLLIGRDGLRRRFPAFVAGWLAPASIHLAMNWSVAGDFRPLLIRADAIAAAGSTLNPEELSGVARHRSTADAFRYLAGLLVDSPSDPFRPRGAFFYMPMGFIAVALAVAALSADRGLRRCQAASLVTATATLIGYLAVNTNNFAGNCFGIRWFVLLVPWWSIAVFSWSASGWMIVARKAAVAAALGFAIGGVFGGPWRPVFLHGFLYWLPMATLALVALSTMFGLPGVVFHRPHSKKPGESGEIVEIRTEN